MSDPLNENFRQKSGERPTKGTVIGEFAESKAEEFMVKNATPHVTLIFILRPLHFPTLQFFFMHHKIRSLSCLESEI